MLTSISRNKKRINQIIAKNRHHSWTATAFGSAKKWRQRRVARQCIFSKFVFHYSWEILTLHFARVIVLQGFASIQTWYRLPLFLRHPCGSFCQDVLKVLHQFRHDPNHLDQSCIFYGFQRQIVVILNNGLWWGASPVTREHETR